MEQKTGLSDEGVPVTRSKTHMHVKDSMLQIWPWMYAIWSYSKFQPLSPDLKKKDQIRKQENVQVAVLYSV